MARVRKRQQLVAADLFCGGGGFTTGAEQSGRFGLAMVSLRQTMNELGVVDIGFRMLDVDELTRAQGFPEGYYLHGTRAEQVKQVGNAVCPPVAKALCETIAEAA